MAVLLQTELTEARCQAFWLFGALAVDGFMRLAVVEESSLPSDAVSDVWKQLCKYALISTPSKIETDIVQLKNALSRRNAFIDKELLNKLTPNLRLN